MPLSGLRHPAAAALCLRLAGRGPNSDSLFPPLAAVVVVAPNEGRLWQSSQSEWFRQRLPSVGELSSVSETERLSSSAALFERREAHKEILSWQKNAFRKL